MESIDLSLGLLIGKKRRRDEGCGSKPFDDYAQSANSSYLYYDGSDSESACSYSCSPENYLGENLVTKEQSSHMLMPQKKARIQVLDPDVVSVNLADLEQYLCPRSPGPDDVSWNLADLEQYLCPAPECDVPSTVFDDVSVNLADLEQYLCPRSPDPDDVSWILAGLEPYLCPTPECDVPNTVFDDVSYSPTDLEQYLFPRSPPGTGFEFDNGAESCGSNSPEPGDDGESSNSSYLAFDGSDSESSCSYSWSPENYLGDGGSCISSYSFVDRFNTKDEIIVIPASFCV